MSDKPLHSNIKNPVVLFVGDHKTDFHSGCKIVDVTFPNVIHPEVKMLLLIYECVIFVNRLGQLTILG